MPAVDWMQNGPFGAMVHWLRSTAPLEDAPELDWDEQVDAFPVEDFCREIAATGAGWLIFTIGQNNGYYCAPNRCMERLYPGHCSGRDLFGDIADCLGTHGVRLIAYLPSGMVVAPGELQEAFAWNVDPCDKSEFMRRYVEFVREYAMGYGERLAGWWFDGCYDRRRTRGTYGNSRFRDVDWFGACRAGNPEAVVAMNPGCNTFQAVFEEEDYVGGETTLLSVRPGTALCGGHQQWHSLLPIGGTGPSGPALWGHPRPGPLPGNRYSFEDLLNYVYDCHVNGGAVTLNVTISREGRMHGETLEQLAAIAKRIGEIRAGRAEAPDLWSPVKKTDSSS
jgi:hypothetical protein